MERYDPDGTPGDRAEIERKEVNYTIKAHLNRRPNASLPSL